MDVIPDGALAEIEVEPAMFLAQLAAGEAMSIQQLHMEPGARVPEHSHHHEQVGFTRASRRSSSRAATRRRRRRQDDGDEMTAAR